MATITEKIFDEALSLPADARMNLVEKLITSLNMPLDKEIERLWAKEAELRISQIEEGKAKLIPGEDVFRKIREKLGK